ncbi:hypothetical protein [Primorskyibacter flagellatus]|uniref:hypothetical protein n=1 Tax=Primorskyibacter flagellatus TaxID=1387277 RepID=UPI003A8E3574
MGDSTEIACSCGQTRLEVQGKHIASIECCCSSRREAAARMQGLDGAPLILTSHDATPFVMSRKDRLRSISGPREPCLVSAGTEYLIRAGDRDLLQYAGQS